MGRADNGMLSAPSSAKQESTASLAGATNFGRPAPPVLNALNKLQQLLFVVAKFYPRAICNAFALPTPLNYLA
jgi:hypothetical protein